MPGTRFFERPNVNGTGLALLSEVGSGGGGVGTTTLDFGAFPGTSDTSVDITGQSAILSGSTVHAWVIAKATADHSIDEHLMEELRVVAGNIVAGTGFTIYVMATGDTEVYGLWSVGWRWS